VAVAGRGALGCVVTREWSSSSVSTSTTRCRSPTWHATSPLTVLVTLSTRGPTTPCTAPPNRATVKVDHCNAGQKIKVLPYRPTRYGALCQFTAVSTHHLWPRILHSIEHWKLTVLNLHFPLIFSARCNVHLALMLRCQCPSFCPAVCLSVCDGSALAHYSNLGFKFRSKFIAHCGRRAACGREGRDHRQEEWRDHLALC